MPLNPRPWPDGYGETMHKGVSYPGEHQAIVPRDLFDAVQNRLGTGRHKSRRPRNTPFGAILTGLMFDDRGNPMRPTYSRKPAGHEHRYYVSSALTTGKPSNAGAIPRVPAQPIEDIVEQRLHRLELIGEPDAKSERGNSLPARDADERQQKHASQLHRYVSRIEIHAHSLVLHLDRAAVIARWRETTSQNDEPSDHDLIAQRSAQLGPSETLESSNDTLVLTLPVRAKFRGGRAHIQSADGRAMALSPHIDPVLVKAIARAHVWTKLLANEEAVSVEALAQRVRQHRGYVRQVIRLAFLSPDVTRAILEGRHRPDLTLAELLEADMPMLWSRQVALVA